MKKVFETNNFTYESGETNVLDVKIKLREFSFLTLYKLCVTSTMSFNRHLI